MSTLLPQAPQIAGAFWRTGNLVLVAEPGAGKTTTLPVALAQHPEAPKGQIWVLQPRRLAARMAATYVAEQLGGQVGAQVGYRIRFADKTTPNTRIVYLTDGMLVRQLARDPTLRGVACVLFDEFHERSLAQDCGLATLVALRRAGRLRCALGVMSATLDHEAVSATLDHVAPTFVAGRTYPVDVAYLPHRPQSALPQTVARALAEALATPLDENDAARGNVLIFLPGVRAIAACMAASASVLARHKVRGLPLHASLPPAAQALPFAPGTGRMVLFATNVAETSLTLPGVRTVIDAGRAKQARQLPLTGLTELVERDISQASAVQRAGRAGRTDNGRCLRLYSLADFRRRPAYDTPEVARLDLASAALSVAHLGLGALEDLPTVDPVDAGAAHAARALLVQLGALDAEGRITSDGAAMVQLGVHPRLARLMLTAHARGIGRLGCEAACALGEQLPPEALPARRPGEVGASDLDDLVAAVRRTPQLRQVVDGLWRTLRGATVGPRAQGDGPPADPDAALTEAVLAGFGDRVAKRLAAGEPSAGARTQAPHAEQVPLALARGGRAVLGPQSQVRRHDFLVVLRAEAQPHLPGAPPKVTCAVGVTPDVLIGGSAAFLGERQERTYDATRGRVMVDEQITYDGLVLMRDGHVERDAQAALPLLTAAFRKGPGQQGAFVAAMTHLRVRLALAATLGLLAAAADGTDAAPPEDVAQPYLDAALDAALHSWFTRGESLNKLDVEAFVPEVRAHLPPEVQAVLDRQLPDQVTLAHGKRLPVHYPEGAAPYIESYLQDFFGNPRLPAIANGKIGLTVHLWGPNRRALQVTRDLPGFWRTHYPQLKPALARRYPRHTWPDDPLQAAPVVRARRR